MEALQQSITLGLKNTIMSSVSSNLFSSCAALDQHFSSLPLFQQLLEQLVNPCQSTCAKDSSVALKSKLEGNAAFKILNHEKAMSSYTKALRYAPFTSKEEDKIFLAAAFVNRAVTLHKLGLLQPAARDCGRAIDIYPSYSKAWFRRSRIKFDMRKLEEALSDMKEALALEKTNSGRKQIENEIAIVEVKLKCRSSPSDNIRHVRAESKTTQRGSPPEVDVLHLHWSDERGFDLRTKKELEVGSLVFEEEAYAAIVLKPNRDTRCHFCFELLPADPVACCGCAIPLYCSNICMLYATAGSRTTSLRLGGNGEQGVNLPEKYANEWDGEHRHECGGCTWPAVLPTEAVLAARIFFRNAVTSKVLHKEATEIGEEWPSYTEGKAKNVCFLKGTRKVDTLCSNYERLSSNDKLEIHVLGVTLAHCVQRAATPYIKGGSQVTAKVASKLVHLIAQTRVNAMAIYCMSSPVPNIDSADTGRNTTTDTVFSAVEQVKVAQGLYLLGSRLNHSCVPNVHASFKSRRLFLHSVSSIPAGSPLHLCYGPQVGHMTQVERRRYLQERYYFECTCSACASVTSSDLFLKSFRCVKQGCMGVVLSPDLNGLHLPFSKISASCNSLRAVETFREGTVGCSSASSVELQGACFTGGCNNVMGETYFDDKDSETGRTNTPHELAVQDINSTGSEIRRKLTGKDMVGRCLECGRPVDVDSAHEAATKAFTRLERIESKMLTPEATVDSLRHLPEGALDALDKLRTVLHAYNEQLAKGEDIVARLFCALDQPPDGLKHCENAVQILEQLYGKHHIVLGNEYLKLASVAIIVPDLECARRNLRNADYIFRIHYGSDYRETLPYITELYHLVHQE